MLIRVIAVGTRMPAWVDEVSQDYSKRLPSEFKLEWLEAKAEKRSAKPSPEEAERCMLKEAQRIETLIPQQALRVALDERGTQHSSVQFARMMQTWQEQARALALVIGGPDGLHANFKASCAHTISLSAMTMAHPLVRVVLAEQLFRAWSIIAKHPYHRI